MRISDWSSDVCSSDLSRLRENGVDVPLPGSDVRIRERRGEASLGATWSPADDWTIEPGLRIERSDITQSGDSPLQRGFTYAKPRLALRWDAGEADEWRLSLSREVGQLDFNDLDRKSKRLKSSR